MTGPGDLTALRRLAERQIKQDFETIKGVAAAQVKGGLEEEIQIDVDQERLAALGIPLDRVRAGASASRNINLPGGALRGARQPVPHPHRQRVRHGRGDRRPDHRRTRTARRCACATWPRCGWGAKEREEITRVNGREAVEIAIYKEGDANTVTAAARCSASGSTAVAGRQAAGGPRADGALRPVALHRAAVNEVRDSALLGGLLAILVLFLFLRDLRSTLIIAHLDPASRSSPRS